MHARTKLAAAISTAMVGCLALSASAGTYQSINLDGNTAEWSTVPVAATASQPGAPIDLTQLKMANDDNFVYFQLSYGAAVNPQSGGGVFLGIDSDNSAATGFNIYGSTLIGANFAFQNDFPFTQTAGSFNSGGSNSDAVYYAAPYNTVTQTQEIAIPLDATQSDGSAGGYSGNIFPSSFTVEFYTTESTVSVLGPYKYTLAGPPSQQTYQLSGSGDFNSPATWGGTVPSGANAEADFLGSITANHTVYSDTDITLGKIVFNNAHTYVLAGAGTLTLASTSGTASVDAMLGIQKITLPITIASSTIFSAESGATLIIGAPVTVNSGMSLTQAGAGSVQYQSTISVLNGGSFSLAANSHIAGLSLSGASTAALVAEPAGPKTALQVDSLSISAASKLDLNNGDLIVHGGSLATIAASVKSGFNVGGPLWTGTGINSSTAAGDGGHLTAIGVIQNNKSGTPVFNTFDGAAVGLNDVLVKTTYFGDADLSGKVTANDYTLIDFGFANHLTGWLNGDFNYDGVIDGSDYTLMDNAYNRQGASFGAVSQAMTAAEVAGSSSAVPEPASAGALLLGAMGVLARRRRSL